MSEKIWITLSEFCAVYDMKVPTVKDACLKGRIASCRKTKTGRWELHKKKAFREFHDNKKINQHTKTAMDTRNILLAQSENQRQYNLEQSVIEAKQKPKQVQYTPGNSESIPPLEFSKQRKEHYAAEKTKTEYMKAAGSLVDLKDVRKTYREIAKTVKDNLLKVPDRVSPLLAVETDERKIMNMLDKEIREALEFLSKGV